MIYVLRDIKTDNLHGSYPSKQEALREVYVCILLFGKSDPAVINLKLIEISQDRYMHNLIALGTELIEMAIKSEENEV